MNRFRFEDFEIWQEACRLGDVLDALADELEATRKYRYAGQLRTAALSVSNNIVEGSGSSSVKDFQNFLNFARRSVYENANTIHFLRRKKTLDREFAEQLQEDCRVLAVRISKFSQSLGS